MSRLSITHPGIEKNAFKVMAVRAEVARLGGSMRYYGAGELLLQTIARALDLVIKDFGFLTRTYDSARSDGERDAVVSAAEGYAGIADLLHQALSYIEGSDEGGTPRSLVEPIESLARVYSPQCSLLVRVSHEGGAGAYWWERFVPSLTKILSQSPVPGVSTLASRLDHVVSIILPGAARENTLMHAVLGHELGHQFLYEDKTTQGIVVPVKQASKKPTDLFELERLKRVGQIVQNWSEELLADAWGLHMMGPAYYFACRELAANTPGSASHPPGNFRLRWLREQLSRRGYLALGDEYSKWVVQEVGAGASEPSGPAPEISADITVENVVGLLEPLAQTVFQLIESKRLEACYRPEQFTTRAPALVDRLCNLVPPNEYEEGKTAAMPDILNAGWIIRLRRWDDFLKAVRAHTLEQRFDALDKLNRLLLKALEYSAIREEWPSR